MKAFLEAEAYDGPSLIIAYSHCIAHGYDLVHGLGPAEGGGAVRLLAAVPLQPGPGCRRARTRLQLDSKAPAIPLEKYIYNETRYTMLTQSESGGRAKLLKEAQEDVHNRWKLYEHWAAMPVDGAKAPEPGPEKAAVAATTAKEAETDMADLTTTYLGLKLKNPLVASASPLCRGPRQHPADGRRRRRGGRAALAVRGADRRWRATNSTAISPRARSVRRSAQHISRPAATTTSGPDAYLEHIREGEGGGEDSGHRQPERHLQGRLDPLRQADGAGRRRRARAEHLLTSRPIPNMTGATVEQMYCDLVRR